MASKIRGNVDLVKDEKGGYLVDVHNIKQYVDRIKEIAENRELGRKMGSWNCSYIKNFDISEVSPKLKRIYSFD